VNQRLSGALEALRTSMPAGTLLQVGGTVEKSGQSNAALIAQVPLMIALMLTVLMFQLGSFRQLGLVISVAPLGLIGVVAALLTTGTPMGFIAILGVIALIGMIIRNSVILVDQIEHERERGLDPWEAVIEATKHSLADAHKTTPRLIRAGFRVLGHHRLLLIGSTLLAAAQRLHLVPKRAGLGRLPLRRGPALEPSATPSTASSPSTSPSAPATFSRAASPACTAPACS
jgi:preprotein translocase subunit SecF